MIKSKNHPDNIKIDEEAIRACASFVKNGPKNLSGHLLKFCFPLGARRGISYSIGKKSIRLCFLFFQT